MRIKKIAERRTIWGWRPSTAAQTSSATMADTMEDVASSDLIVSIPKGTVIVQKVEEVGPCVSIKAAHAVASTHERASDAVMRFLGFEENCPTTGILDFVGSDGASWEVVTERVVNCAEINSMAWRRGLTTRPSQHARRVVAPTHWLISTQIIELLAFVEGELAKEE